MLLEAAGWSLSQSSDHVLARLSDELSPHAFPGTHAAVVELATGIHPDVDGSSQSWRRCPTGCHASWVRWDCPWPPPARIR